MKPVKWINPIAYAVKIGNSGNIGYNFTSHKFIGLNEKTNEWEILDERCNSNDLIATNSFMLYYTKSSDKYYTAFKIQQTDPGNSDFWGILNLKFWNSWLRTISTFYK